jgi:hypothetical protein
VPKGTVSLKAGIVKGLDWIGGVHIFTNSAMVSIPDSAKAYKDQTPGMPGRRNKLKNVEKEN